MTLSALMARWHHRPLRNCPGRYVVVNCPTGLTPEDIVGSAIRVTRYRVPAARDSVFVAVLPQGGLISYQHADGTFVHTLNDEQGFRRKLEQLGIK